VARRPWREPLLKQDDAVRWARRNRLENAVADDRAEARLVAERAVETASAPLPERAPVCEECGRKSTRKFCSKRCETQHHNKARSARAAAARADKTCEACGRPFTPKRVDARTCSPACRQKLYRLEKARATPVR